MTEKTIQQALLDCVTEKDFLGKGKNYSVYSLQSIGLEPYVLRVLNSNDVNKPYNLHELATTTSLTPPKQLARGANIGQPLLEIGDKHTSIRLRQSGTTLENDLLQKQKALGSVAAARIALMGEIVSASQRTGTNPFLVAARELQGLVNGGYRPDPSKRNVLWNKDRGKFGLVDQVQIIESSRSRHAAGMTLSLDALWTEIGGSESLASLPDPARHNAPSMPARSCSMKRAHMLWRIS